MISRHVNLSKLLGNQSSAILLGARGLGKTLLSNQWLEKQDYIAKYDLLNPGEFKRLLTKPEHLINELETLLNTVPPGKVISVLIDEVQKVPELLNVCHLLIEKHAKRIRFLLTGSSARKLKAKNVNLLASRALSIHLHPFTYYELSEQNYSLIDIMQYGSIPAIIFAENKLLALKTYVDMYLKEEIQQEALVRRLDKFFGFIDLAAQLNGEIVNMRKLARQIDVADKTIADYYQILIDTLLIVKLPGWARSVKKQIIKSPKYYFFDIGVMNAAARELHSTLEEGSSRYGRLFEHFVILEFYRLNSYFSKDYLLSFYSNGTAEVDLILSRSKAEVLIGVEIKSNAMVYKEDLSGLELFANEYKNSKLYCITTCDKPYSITLNSGATVAVLPYQNGIKSILGITL